MNHSALSHHCLGIFRSVFILTMVLTGCDQHEALPAPGRAVAVADRCPDSDDESYYFPTAALVPSRPVWDQSIRAYASRYLRAADMRSISCGQAVVGDEIYRLTRLEITRATHIVEVRHIGEYTQLDVVELEGPTWKGPGKQIRHDTRRLATHAWELLTGTVEQSRFWELSEEPQGTADDGSPWIVEGRRGSGYHAVDRTSPRGTPYHALATHLLTLGGVSDQP